MSLTISGIKESISNGLTMAYNETGKLNVYSVTWIKPGLNITQTYLQDRRIAVISLFAFCFLSTGISDYIEGKIVKLNVKSKKLPDNLLLPVNLAIGLGIYFGSLAAFTKLVPLPLSNTQIMAISFARLLLKVV